MSTSPEPDERLDRIVEGIVRIAAGNLDTHIPISGARDQVDAVTTGINLLAAELSSVYQDLEQRVEQRTTELREAHYQMLVMAMTDPLTGTANRLALMDAVGKALDAWTGNTPPPAVLMIDLDGFKDINDTYGHQAGDQVLMQIAMRLTASVPANAVVARLGGDEFAVLLPEASLTRALAVASRIQDRVGERILVDELNLWPRASVGVHSAEEGQNAEDLLLRADTAMYVAKDGGPGKIKAFEPVMLYSRQLRRETAAELRHAAERGELFLAYQPVVELATGRMEGMEVLVRWNHPTRGLLMPDVFIPVAEETGMIVELGRWVLRTALDQHAQWRRDFPETAPRNVRVNVSPTELQSMDLVDHVRRALRETGTPPSSLILEITESAFVTGGEVETYSMKSLKALGVGLEIDDFGTGYSSISYLRRLPVDTVKVDRSLIADISRDEGQLQFVDAVHRLIQAAGMQAVFEGIENAHQAEQLLTMGCCSGQGYYFSRPLSAAQVQDVLCSRQTLPLKIETPA